MPISLLELLLRLGTSVLLGGAIGYERERREQPAGLRTHFLVSLASATFMIVSTQFVFFQNYINDGLVHVDVGRIASNVVVGIGFLGGGAILHAGLHIKGLTTAASLWLVAAVGLAAGAGMFVLAVSGRARSPCSPWSVLRILERNFKNVAPPAGPDQDRRRIPDPGAVRASLGRIGAEVTDVEYARDRVRQPFRDQCRSSPPRHELEEPMVKILEDLPSVRSLRVQRTGN